MKRLCIFCAALCLLLGACAPTLLGENDPEYGAPKGGQLDTALACAVDLALAGGDPLMRESNALPNEVKGAEASQASLHKLQDGESNSWRGREALYSLTAGPVFRWRGQRVRSVHVHRHTPDGVKAWSGLAVRDSRNVWRFVDRVPRWSSADTLAFYKGIDKPGDGQGNTWNSNAGPCSLILRNTDIKGNNIIRNFSLQVGDVTMEGVVSRQATHAWQLEEAR